MVAKIDQIGKSIFVWRIPTIAKTADEFVAATLAMKLNSVMIKMADGNTKYGDWLMIRDIRLKLAKAGVAVLGWHYIYGNDPTGELAIANMALNEINPDFWLIDAEQEFKNPLKANAAVSYAGALNRRQTPVGLTSYRFPTYHKEFLWNEFLRNVDFVVPQVYWVGSSNPGDQLRRTIAEYADLYKTVGVAPMPMIPAGAAYSEGGWSPTVAQLNEFQATAVSLNLPGYSFWEWGLSIKIGLADDIAAMPKYNAEPDKLEALEARVARIESFLAQGKQFDK